MESVLIAALVAATPLSATAERDGRPAPLDISCFQLMAELADDENPQVRTVARTAAQYFLGRIDAEAPGFDPASAPPPAEASRPGLIRRCGAALDATGRDFEALSRALPAGRPTA